MKVAIYIQDMRASGVARTTMAIGRALAEGGDDVTMIAGGGSGLFGAADVAPAGFVIADPREAGRFARLAVVPRLRRTLRRLRPDAILSAGNFGHFSLWAATRGLDIPIVYRFSNPMTRAGQPVRNLWRRLWTNLLIAGAARAILVGASLAADPAFRDHVARGKAVVIRNGIDLSRARAPSGPTPSAIAGPDPVVLSIGRLQPQKNFEGLIDAVAAASRTRRLRLVILGAGSDASRDALAAHARERGIADRLDLAGITDDVFAWLRAASVFALASRWEGSSIALLEAMAAGTPVVASRSAGDAPEVIDGDRYGLLVDADDIDGFARALVRQIDDPVRPGNRAADFDAAAMTRAYRALLHEAVGPELMD